MCRLMCVLAKSNLKTLDFAVKDVPPGVSSPTSDHFGKICHICMKLGKSQCKLNPGVCLGRFLPMGMNTETPLSFNWSSFMQPT